MTLKKGRILWPCGILRFLTVLRIKSKVFFHIKSEVKYKYLTQRFFFYKRKKYFF